MKVFTKETPVAPKWTYEWAGKDEPRLSLADIVAGAAMEHTISRDSRWWSQLVADVVTSILTPET